MVKMIVLFKMRERTHGIVEPVHSSTVLDKMLR